MPFVSDNSSSNACVSSGNASVPPHPVNGDVRTVPVSVDNDQKHQTEFFLYIVILPQAQAYPAAVKKTNSSPGEHASDVALENDHEKVEPRWRLHVSYAGRSDRWRLHLSYAGRSDSQPVTHIYVRVRFTHMAQPARVSGSQCQLGWKGLCFHGEIITLLSLTSSLGMYVYP